ncbi:hypothetical protein BOTBODRAFT_621399 [Botryobasidium botryosum FD-172 SS1]|uniref:Transmembrane protein n=1 Tax=Botryobasidium botryosum (strain FD-172 SS1) TaxID=930990 RepID=A0A067MY07_BOTB1|nr:hypothetical protein BOTBODRAFT_621399 [Botryobasidium botryosum FD-172 SS1]
MINARDAVVCCVEVAVDSNRHLPTFAPARANHLPATPPRSTTTSTNFDSMNTSNSNNHSGHHRNKNKNHSYIDMKSNINRYGNSYNINIMNNDFDNNNNNNNNSFNNNNRFSNNNRFNNNCYNDNDSFNNSNSYNDNSNFNINNSYNGNGKFNDNNGYNDNKRLAVPPSVQRVRSLAQRHEALKASQRRPSRPSSTTLLSASLLIIWLLYTTIIAWWSPHSQSSVILNNANGSAMMPGGDVALKGDLDAIAGSDVVGVADKFTTAYSFTSEQVYLGETCVDSPLKLALGVNEAGYLDVNVSSASVNGEPNEIEPPTNEIMCYSASVSDAVMDGQKPVDGVFPHKLWERLMQQYVDMLRAGESENAKGPIVEVVFREDINGRIGVGLEFPRSYNSDMAVLTTGSTLCHLFVLQGSGDGIKRGVVEDTFRAMMGWPTLPKASPVHTPSPVFRPASPTTPDGLQWIAQRPKEEVLPLAVVSFAALSGFASLTGGIMLFATLLRVFFWKPRQCLVDQDEGVIDHDEEWRIQRRFEKSKAVEEFEESSAPEPQGEQEGPVDVKVQDMEGLGEKEAAELTMAIELSLGHISLQYDGQPIASSSNTPVKTMSSLSSHPSQGPFPEKFEFSPKCFSTPAPATRRARISVFTDSEVNNSTDTFGTAPVSPSPVRPVLFSLKLDASIPESPARRSYVTPRASPLRPHPLPVIPILADAPKPTSRPVVKLRRFAVFVDPPREEKSVPAEQGQGAHAKNAQQVGQGKENAYPKQTRKMDQGVGGKAPAPLSERFVNIAPALAMAPLSFEVFVEESEKPAKKGSASGRPALVPLATRKLAPVNEEDDLEDTVAATPAKVYQALVKKNANQSTAKTSSALRTPSRKPHGHQQKRVQAKRTLASPSTPVRDMSRRKVVRKIKGSYVLSSPAFHFR